VRGRRGRRFVEAKYDWKRVFDPLARLERGWARGSDEPNHSGILRAQDANAPP
jgi:hypothetical protein